MKRALAIVAVVVLAILGFLLGCTTTHGTDTSGLEARVLALEKSVATLTSAAVANQSLVAQLAISGPFDYGDPYGVDPPVADDPGPTNVPDPQLPN